MTLLKQVWLTENRAGKETAVCHLVCLYGIHDPWFPGGVQILALRLVSYKYFLSWPTQSEPRGQGWTCFGKIHSWQDDIESSSLMLIACESS